MSEITNIRLRLPQDVNYKLNILQVKENRKSDKKKSKHDIIIELLKVVLLNNKS
jgi:hypothetical protein